MSACLRVLSGGLPTRVSVCVHACARLCVNGKLTAAVKFLSEHHRGEADGS